MAFYIRKAFKVGSLRLNLSKSGLGLSAGVTGARVGINSRGTYVHGGRHGLYYRKYMKVDKKSTALSSKINREGGTSNYSNSVALFHDTGVTFPSQSAELRKISRKEPALPSSTLVDTPFKIASGGTFFLFIFSLVDDMEWLIIPTMILGMASLGWMGWNNYWKKKSELALKKSTVLTETQKKLSKENILLDEKTPDRWRIWFAQHLHALIGELAMRHDEIDTLSTLRILDDEVPADKKVVERIRVSIFGNLLDEMLEDHLLSEKEEESIKKLLNQLTIPDNMIALELERLDHFSRVRKEIERPLAETDPGIPLVRGEIAYEVFDHSRLLNERVLNRFQRDKVHYRELGYEVYSEGKLIITDRRLLILDRGSKEYRLNRLVDITADPEAGIVELNFSDRKSPVLITVKEPLVLAARLEKILEEKVE
jgi:hypothetical protein